MTSLKRAPGSGWIAVRIAASSVKSIARRGEPTIHQEEHFGAIGRGGVRVKSLETMLHMLEKALEQG